MAPSKRRLQFRPTPSHAVLIEVVQDACALLECRQPLDMCAAIRPVQELAALVPRMVRAERQESFGTQSCEELPAVEKPGLAPYQISVSACPLKAKNLDECCPPPPCCRSASLAMCVVLCSSADWRMCPRPCGRTTQQMYLPSCWDGLRVGMRCAVAVCNQASFH